MIRPPRPIYQTQSTSGAKVLQWGGENDITFDHALYAGTDPESFLRVDVILNQFEF